MLKMSHKISVDEYNTKILDCKRRDLNHNLYLFHILMTQIFPLGTLFL